MPSFKQLTLKASLAALLIAPTALVQAAATDADVEQCVIEKLKEVNANTLVSQIRAECKIEVKQPQNDPTQGAFSQRIISENASKYNSHVITPHRMNYILPVSITDNRNTEVYRDAAPQWSDNIEDHESKYQLSLKVPLNGGDLFTEGDGLYFGMTLNSWWQVYSENISKPFRETNYLPEVFYITGLDWHPMGGNTGLIMGVEHQSNGRSNAFSRSWNRVYLNLLWEKENLLLSLKPWYRLSEDEKEVLEDGTLDPDGDDNPDIMDYMGYFQFGAAYQYENLEFSMGIRQNFATHKGALELGMTFPLWGRLRGYAQYFTGYGESLIDYNHNQQTFGIGIAITDIL
ncbi:phospholipase A [Thalassomonas sp. M1454]|uniref:phospholipase A n=1 Tax=Thalassomonas sp. M1454 TaxID=2594477 RepID=UPI00117C5317|nr:phospholipase A [Thalassomonas sp. M1454]TRX57034.1 phospholipase A [Thalassomonas sp. M1454]